MKDAFILIGKEILKFNEKEVVKREELSKCYKYLSYVSLGPTIHYKELIYFYLKKVLNYSYSNLNCKILKIIIFIKLFIN